jgi:hypothetical protein
MAHRLTDMPTDRRAGMDTASTTLRTRIQLVTRDTRTARTHTRTAGAICTEVQ